MQPGTVQDRTRPRSRPERELARLEALDARRRWRVLRRGGLRGGLGAGASLWTLIKLKLLGSLGGKLAIAAVIGLGVAWPMLLVVLLASVALGLAIAILTCGEIAEFPFLGPDDVRACKGTRVRRLEDLIARRRAWLAAPSGLAPSVRRDAQERASHRRGSAPLTGPCRSPVRAPRRPRDVFKMQLWCHRQVIREQPGCGRSCGPRRPWPVRQSSYNRG